MFNPNCFTEEILKKRMDRTESFLNRGDAFTLIEILIVVVIIAIAAMIVVPLAGSTASIQIKSTANMIAADLEYAKSRAITQGQRFSMVIDENTETYRIEDHTGSVIEHPVKKGSQYIVNLQQKGLDKVDISNANFDSTSTVSFDYLGSPYNGSGGPLNNGVITLQAGTTTVQINVEPVTGFISVTE